MPTSSTSILIPSDGGTNYDPSVAVKKHYIKLFDTTDQLYGVNEIRVSGIPYTYTTSNTIGSLAGIQYNSGLHEFNLFSPYSGFLKVSDYVSNLNEIIKNNNIVGSV